MDGCPAQFTFKEPLSNKLEFISCGNSKSFANNPALVKKTMNKEDRYSHLVPMDPLLCKLSPYLWHTIQSIIIKEGKSDCIVWDSSTVICPTDIVMNQVTPVAKEAPITFEQVKGQVYADIYNTLVSYPNARILLGLEEINACFRFARIHVDLTSASGFIADDLFNLATAMVFGSTASASSWEAFCRAIEALTKVFANRPDLVIKHQRYLDMIRWDDISLPINITQAFPCTINWGIIDDRGNRIDLPAWIYVDNAVMLAINIKHLKMVLVAMIEAIFVVMGEPNKLVWQCPLAMDKWSDLIIGPQQTILGLVIDTDKMMVSIPNKYRHKVLNLLNTTWHSN